MKRGLNTLKTNTPSRMWKYFSVQCYPISERTSFCLRLSRLRPLLSIMKMRKSVWCKWDDSDSGKPKYWQKNCHFADSHSCQLHTEFLSESHREHIYSLLGRSVTDIKQIMTVWFKNNIEHINTLEWRLS
jgi:hypothetical protein